MIVRRKLHTIAIASLILMIQQSFGQISNTESLRLGPQLSAEERETLFLQAMSIRADSQVPQLYRARVADVPAPKCGTMTVNLVRANLHLYTQEQQRVFLSAFDRPSLPLSTPSPAGGFRIHYAASGSDSVPLDDQDGNGLPDYIDSVAANLDATHDIEVGQLGYRPPPPDNGVDGPEYDIYIHNLRGVYGLTTTDGSVPGTPWEDRTSYIEMDNDYSEGFFSEGLAGALVTIAHEYYHALQFGYRLFQTNQEPFYYELTAVWMEDFVYDDINDYYGYLNSFFRRPTVSFNRFDPFLHYLGETVWNHYLAKKIKEIELFRRTWEIMQSNVLAMDALNQTLFEAGSSFAEEFAEFALWNYFTGARADTVRFYEEGKDYPLVSLNGDFTFDGDTTIVDSSLSASFRYYKFTSFVEDGLLVTGNSPEPENIKIGAVVIAPSGVASLYLADLRDGLDLGFLPRLTEIILVPVNVEVLDGPQLSQLTTKYTNFTLRLVRVPAEGPDEQGITAIYPNPFIVPKHGQIRIEFFPQSSSDLEVRILSAGGVVVKSDRLVNGTGALTSSSFVWSGMDDRNEPVASGVYVVQLKQNGFIQHKKLAIIQE